MVQLFFDIPVRELYSYLLPTNTPKHIQITNEVRVRLQEEQTDDNPRSLVATLLANLSILIVGSHEAKRDFMTLYQSAGVPALRKFEQVTNGDYPTAFLTLPSVQLQPCCMVFAVLWVSNEELPELRADITRILKRAFPDIAEKCKPANKIAFRSLRMTLAGYGDMKSWRQSKLPVAAVLLACKAARLKADGDMDGYERYAKIVASSCQRPVVGAAMSYLRLDKSQTEAYIKKYQNTTRLADIYEQHIRQVKELAEQSKHRTTQPNHRTDLYSSVCLSAITNKMLDLSDILNTSGKLSREKLQQAVDSAEAAVAKSVNIDQPIPDDVIDAAVIINAMLDTINDLRQQVLSAPESRPSDSIKSNVTILNKELEKARADIERLTREKDGIAEQLEKANSQYWRDQKADARRDKLIDALQTDKERLEARNAELLCKLEEAGIGVTDIPEVEDLTPEAANALETPEDAQDEGRISTTDLQALTQDKQIIVVGGTEYWQARVRAIYPNLTVVGAGLSRENLKEYPNADLMLINNLCLSHVLYHKYFDSATRHNVPVAFIPRGQSIQTFENALSDALEGLSDDADVSMVRLEKHE